LKAEFFIRKALHNIHNVIVSEAKQSHKIDNS